ncbi:idi-2 precursor protein [Stemphylium lycopersici]|uniref:Idi-2 protein n=1 Tax=Stemphylium lycopersici TaxID=183478 RepID=A0A364NCU0_STELY|nr:idi-2 precursor protein [Stemphylium lycopersici]RAR07868.1 idi-2 precursor protein [Stemphylium lycopersici]RAR15139.1 idi-2 precursor protein [Stemphylium lycopersici]
MKFFTFVPFLLAIGATTAMHSGPAPAEGEAVRDLSADRPSHADIERSDVQLMGTNSINPRSLKSGNLVKRECQKGGSFGCSAKGWCWKECGAGNWCWTAHNGGSGQWISCGKSGDCNRGQACSIGGCDECGCSGCTK